MTLYTTESTIISDITPEWAARDTPGADRAWRLSWLPDRRLTREQATAGMELDELLSDPDRVHDRMQLARIDDCADRLGLLRDHAIILLAKRIAARVQTEPVPPLVDRRRVIEPPFAHR
ncbi:MULTISPECIES: hypothetical protein [unclassified Nocardia]|uniref:hypothetical protein n=1 Tax=unclassified Nocardia TaxID=2637762 RepID=UPI001CE48045|nr:MULTISPECIES: hypothetical protein [unclassified Nocardia]